MKPDLIKLIEKYMEFNSATGREDLRNFSVWLNHNISNPVRTGEDTSLLQMERDISYLLNRISRFSRYHTRKVLMKHGITSIDEFYFLLSIGKLESPSKNDVYRDTITELTTGAQIMKRLIHNGMVEELKDEKDKRVKRVRLTEKGEETKNVIFDEFSETVKLKTGNLSREKKKNLLDTLIELNSFHTLIYETDPDESIPALIKKYIISK